MQECMADHDNATKKLPVALTDKPTNLSQLIDRLTPRPQIMHMHGLLKPDDEKSHAWIFGKICCNT